jgi:hypothetical protein
MKMKMMTKTGPRGILIQADEKVLLVERGYSQNQNTETPWVAPRDAIEGRGTGIENP